MVGCIGIRRAPTCLEVWLADSTSIRPSPTQEKGKINEVDFSTLLSSLVGLSDYIGLAVHRHECHM